MLKFIKRWTFKNPPPIPSEISALCKKAGMIDREVENIWKCRVRLGDNHSHKLQKMWKDDKQGALMLVEGWCACHKDKLDIEQGMVNFIKNFPDMEPSKWELQNVSLIKLWMAGDSINLAVRSLKRRVGGSFRISTDGTVLDQDKNILEKWNVVGEISRFSEVDLITAGKMLKWLINASQYDKKKLLFKGCESSYLSVDENNYLILS